MDYLTKLREIVRDAENYLILIQPTVFAGTNFPEQPS